MSRGSRNSRSRALQPGGSSCGQVRVGLGAERGQEVGADWRSQTSGARVRPSRRAARRRWPERPTRRRRRPTASRAPAAPPAARCRPDASEGRRAASARRTRRPRSPPAGDPNCSWPGRDYTRGPLSGCHPTCRIRDPIFRLPRPSVPGDARSFLRLRPSAVAALRPRRSWCAPAPAQSGHARPQGDDGFGPTRGVFIPWRTLAGDADGSALRAEPGAAGAARRREPGARRRRVVQRDALPGRGWGCCSAPSLVAKHFGIGLQGVGGSHGAARWTGAPSCSSATRCAWGARWASAPAGAHIFGSAYGGTDTFDAGASWRLCPGLSPGRGRAGHLRAPRDPAPRLEPASWRCVRWAPIGWRWPSPRSTSRGGPGRRSRRAFGCWRASPTGCACSPSWRACPARQDSPSPAAPTTA